MKKFQPQGDRYWIERKYNDKKRDWSLKSKNWIKDYWDSETHPHREKIISEIKRLIPFESILEIGCNCGPNLSLIRDRFPYLKDHNLYGIDLNYLAIKQAQKLMPEVSFRVANVSHIPTENIFDIVLLDAVLMYVGPEEIDQAISEIDRITKKAVILVEWYDHSLKGVIKYFHWARNYEKIFKKLGYDVKKIKLTEKEWPSKNWQDIGYIFIAVRQSQILETNLESELAFKNIIRSSTLLNV